MTNSMGCWFPRFATASFWTDPPSLDRPLDVTTWQEGICRKASRSLDDLRLSLIEDDARQTMASGFMRLGRLE